MTLLNHILLIWRWIKDLNRYSRSLFVGSFLLDVEIFNLIGLLSSGNNIQEFSQAVLLEVLLSQILQVSLWEWDVSRNGDLVGISWYVDLFTEVSDLTLNFNSSSQELSKVAGVENFIFNWSWTINWKAVADFLLLGDSFAHGYKLILLYS